MQTEKPAGVDGVHILWISEGMSCDGDTVSITAATQPSIGDVVLGIIPGLPKVHLQNKVLAYETGERYLTPFRQAAKGGLGPFVLVIEGSIPTSTSSTATASGPRSATTSRAIPSRSTRGSTRSRRRPSRWWRSGPAPPTASPNLSPA